MEPRSLVVSDNISLRIYYLLLSKTLYLPHSDNPLAYFSFLSYTKGAEMWVSLFKWAGAFGLKNLLSPNCFSNDFIKLLDFTQIFYYTKLYIDINNWKF